MRKREMKMKAQKKNREQTKNKESRKELSPYLQHRLLDGNEDLNQNPPSLEDLKSEYIQFLIEVTDYDLEEVANILNASRAVDDRVLKKLIFSSFN
jgi:ActR/RegA family two-component response regulator